MTEHSTYDLQDYNHVLTTYLPGPFLQQLHLVCTAKASCVLPAWLQRSYLLDMSRRCLRGMRRPSFHNLATVRPYQRLAVAGNAWTFRCDSNKRPGISNTTYAVSANHHVLVEPITLALSSDCESGRRTPMS